MWRAEVDHAKENAGTSIQISEGSLRACGNTDRSTITIRSVSEVEITSCAVAARLSGWEFASPAAGRGSSEAIPLKPPSKYPTVSLHGETSVRLPERLM